MLIQELCEPEKDKDGNEYCAVPIGTQRGFKSGQVDPKLADASDKVDNARYEEIYNYEDGLSDEQWNLYDNAIKKYIQAGGKSHYKAYMFAKQHVEKTKIRGSTVVPPAVKEKRLFHVKERLMTTAQKLIQMQHYWDDFSHLAEEQTKKKSMISRFGIFNIEVDGNNKILSFDCCRHGYSEGKSPHKKGTKKYNDHMAAIHAGESIESISIDEVAPPGREKQVKKLKQKYGADSDVPFKIAWAQHNKHGVPD